MLKYLVTSLILFAAPSVAYSTALSVDDIKEILLTDAYEIFTGDDGMECEAEVENLEIVQQTATAIEVRFTALRDITVHGCAPETMLCTGSVFKSARGFWTADTKCL